MSDASISSDPALDAERVVAADLLPLVYHELRRLAASKMAAESADHTLDATALVHEAFLKLGGDRPFASRSDFFRAAAEAMRQILVDHARAKRADKRGGDRVRVTLDGALNWAVSADHVLDLDDVLRQFAKVEPRKAELVTLRFFAGLTTVEAAAALGISVPTAERWWTFARTWLFAEMDERNSGNP